MVIATDEYEGRIRADLSEDFMDSVLIRSDVRLMLANLVGGAFGAAQHRGDADEPDRPRPGEVGDRVHKSADRQDARVRERQRTVLVAVDHEGRRVALAVFLAESPPERCQHVLGRVAVLEAGEDHEVLSGIDFGRHARIIRRFRNTADLVGHYRVVFIPDYLPSDGTLARSSAAPVGSEHDLIALMVIDHVAILVPDAVATARDLRERYGLGSERGSYLPLAGTRMHTVWLEPPQYLEFHTIENREVAATTDSGRIVLACESAGFGMLGWAVLVDDLEAVSERLGIEIFDYTIPHGDGTLRGGARPAAHRTFRSLSTTRTTATGQTGCRGCTSASGTPVRRPATRS